MSFILTTEFVVSSLFTEFLLQ